MSEVRWKVTGDVHDAGYFLEHPTVNPSDFECKRCRAAALLCSWKKKNLRKPHYRFMEPHAEKCLRPGPPPGGPSPGPDHPPPVRVIDELLLRNLEVNTDGPGHPRPPGPTGPGVPEPGPGGPHPGRTARGLRAVVKQYVESPDEIGSYPLQVRGASADTYGKLFRVLSIQLNDPAVLRIYYGSISYTAPLVERPDGLEFTFHHGLPDQRFRLLVRTDKWRPGEKTAIRDEISSAKEKTRGAAADRRAAAGSGSNKESAPKPWVFFLGRCTTEDPLLFVVDHPGAVCTFIMEKPNLGGLS